MALPPVPDTFRWTQESWGTALRCTPLELVASHLFTTRELALTEARDLDRLAAAVGARRVAMVTQVHKAGEHLRTSDRGITLQRRMLKHNAEIVARGGDPLGAAFDEASAIVVVPSGNFYKDSKAA